MKPFVGVQQLQLGKALTSKNEARRILLNMKSSGFDAIELNGFMIRKTPILAKLLLSLSGMSIKKSQSLPWESLIKESGIRVISIHEDLGTLEEDFDKVRKEIEIFAPRYIVLTGMYRFSYDKEEDLGNLIVRLNRIGRKLKEEGIDFLYHNHNAEFQDIFDGVKAYEVLLNGLNPEWVNFEFDSFWASEAGADSLDWMKRLGKRMRLYHICDRGNRNSGPYMTPILKEDAVELGKGNMNLSALIEQALDNEVDGIILEQHRNYIANDPMASLRISGEYLKKAL